VIAQLAGMVVGLVALRVFAVRGRETPVEEKPCRT
jgi:hypothetical protein